MLCSTVFTVIADQIAAIVERHDLHALRQRAVGVELGHRLAHARHHLHGALELLHQHDAVDDVGLVVAAGHAEPRTESDLVLGDIRQQHRQTALLRQHDIVHVLDRGQDAEPAHVDRLLAERDRAAADVGVAGADRGDDLRQRQVERPHPVEVDLGLEFLGLAAEHQHVGDARHETQPALHHPVLQRPQLDQVDVRRTDELVAEDFADRAGRRDDRLHAGRKLDVLQPVERLLAHEVVVAAVFELQADEAQRKHRVGADVFQPRRAGDRDLDRDRDVALDLLRRLAGILRDDLDDRRRRIGIGLDVHGAERAEADGEKRHECDQHQRPPGQARRDQAANHGRPAGL